MQSSSRNQPFKLVLAGASPATDASCPRSSVRFRATPCEGGGRRCNSCRGRHFAPVPQQLQGEFRKLVFVGASPTGGSSFNGDHDVTAASRPVKAFVPVQIRLVTPILATPLRRHFTTTTRTQEAVWQTNRSIKTARFFEITSKRRKGFPSESNVKRGRRVVHGDKELQEKLGRNDPCPCGSGRSF